MSVQLPDLPYSQKALSPHISEETLSFHYGRHHKAYVDKVNTFLQGHSLEKAPLEEIVKQSSGALFNNAAQVFNHNLYFKSLSPAGGGEPPPVLAQALEKGFGSVEKFKESFTQRALSQFGSGWAWLFKTAQGRLEVSSTSNAGTPLQQGHVPLLVCDVWEHAYYIDYRNKRPEYLKSFWHLVNWELANQNLDL